MGVCFDIFQPKLTYIKTRIEAPKRPTKKPEKTQENQKKPKNTPKNPNTPLHPGEE